jgi:hypothetical protein
MIIPLTISQGLISVLATIRIPNWRVYGVVKFFIDTGSPKTFIGEQDAIKLQMRLSRIDYTERARMGGTSISIGEIKEDVHLYFKTDKESIPVKPERFYVSKGMWTRDGITSPNPSILGYDFLLENGFALYYNPSENVAYLERKEHTTMQPINQP